LLQRLSPVTTEDRLGKTEYISNRALGDPETAMFLASKEQMRLMRLLPDYLTPISPDRDIVPATDQRMLHEGFQRLDSQVTNYLDALLKKPAVIAAHENVMESRQFSSLLRELESSLSEFVSTIQSSSDSLASHPLSIQFIESLRTILVTAVESFESPERQGLEIILTITADKGDLLYQIRQEFIRKNKDLDQNQLQSLYSLTILFERICWILRKMTFIRMNVS